MSEKKRTEPDWQDLRVFLALARHGSLSTAARTLSVTHATVARRIQTLEITLGEKLVERRPEGYVLTPAGTQALHVASAMEVAIQTLGRGGSDDSPKGVVRVNAPPALGQGFLIARLAAAASQFPGLDIEFATELRAVSLERRETDIAVRLNRPQDGDVMAKPLVAMGYGFYGMPTVCERVEQGAEPTFISFDELNTHVLEASWLATHFPQARIAFRTGNLVTQAIAARSCEALALLPHYVGRTHGLHLCKLKPIPPSRDVWLLTRRVDRNTPPIKAVTELIADAFTGEHALFEPHLNGAAD